MSEIMLAASQVDPYLLSYKIRVFINYQSLLKGIHPNGAYSPLKMLYALKIGIIPGKWDIPKNRTLAPFTQL